MKRHYLISDTTVRIILKEIKNLKKNCISTPDTEASYDYIVATLCDL
jgi:hypothetical protein